MKNPLVIIVIKDGVVDEIHSSLTNLEMKAIDIDYDPEAKDGLKDLVKDLNQIY